MEKLLGQKSFDRLTQTEKEFVLDSLTEEEYERFSAFLKVSKASSEKDFDGIHPSSWIKSNIMAAYLQRFNEKVRGSFFKVNDIMKRPVARKVLIYAPIAASIILAVVLFFKFNNSNSVESNTRTTAMDVDQIENFELLKEQMSLNEIGLYSKIIVPKIDMGISLIESDTLLVP